MKFNVRVFNGNVIFRKEDKESYAKHLSKLHDTDCVCEITERKKFRTNPQNRYYFGVLIPIIAEWSGNKKDEVHEYLKAKFLFDKSGKIPRIKSTTELSTKEFSKYWEEITLFFAESFQVVIPAPNDPFMEQLLTDFQNKNLQ